MFDSMETEVFYPGILLPRYKDMVIISLIVSQFVSPLGKCLKRIHVPRYMCWMFDSMETEVFYPGILLPRYKDMVIISLIVSQFVSPLGKCLKRIHVPRYMCWMFDSMDTEVF